MTRRAEPGDYYGGPAPDLRTSDAVRKAMRAYLLARDGRACARCGDPIGMRETPSIGHVIARAVGGSDAPDNLRLEHLACNQRAGVDRGRARVVANHQQPPATTTSNHQQPPATTTSNHLDACACNPELTSRGYHRVECTRSRASSTHLGNADDANVQIRGIDTRGPAFQPGAHRQTEPSAARNGARNLGLKRTNVRYTLTGGR